MEEVTYAASASHAQSFDEYRKDVVEPLEKAIAARHAGQFRTAFRAAGTGCNACHKAHKRGFLVTPQVPPRLSILALPPAGGQRPQR